MTRMVEAPPGMRVLVMMPDGYRVWPDEYDYADDRTYFMVSVEGVGENGERVTVRGNHIARVQPALVCPAERLGVRGGLVQFGSGPRLANEARDALRALRDALAPLSLPDDPVQAEALHKAWDRACGVLARHRG